MVKWFLIDIDCVVNNSFYIHNSCFVLKDILNYIQCLLSKVMWDV